ncbi:hypothetical protein MABM_14660 [Mycobacteroides abscessus]|uniref:hypothetical protein n=1 Tax=Mycobacteroides abscessus TaxID=36809 RepID=UPI0003A07867|nr:hypothetical protein [Mycobacteroides abscessus]BBZ81550.1 hypothetical protein MABM_14660 [Mycobacteroides abscessus]
MAYDAAQKKLAMQDATLGNVRTRANTLLATSALFTSFSAGIGLLNTDASKGPVFPACAATWLAVIMVLLGACVVYISWTVKEWHYVPSARIILEKIGQQKTEDEIREFVAKAMIDGATTNAPELSRRQLAFRVANILLIIEVSLLVGVLIASRGGGI